VLVLVVVLVLELSASAAKRDSDPRFDFVPTVWWPDICVLEHEHESAD
jgi:hypothetical protein